MSVYWQGDGIVLWHGDCVKVMADMPADRVHAIVCDPPYELGFMGKSWDSTGVAYAPDTWRAALRVLKPGGHLLAFGGTRTWHRLAVAIEDAGFELRDSIAWMYGSGFPKSHDASKAIDKAAGAEREVVGRAAGARNGNGRNIDYGAFGSAEDGTYSVTAPATAKAAKWQGWGTALKPAHEPLVWGIKPAGPGVVLTEMGSHLDRLESEWLALDQDLPTRTGVVEGSPDQTDTSLSESAAITSWNIVKSWKLSWVELSEATNTSTTSTASRTTTDLITLSSYLAEITATSMLTSLTNPSGPPSIVSAVDNLFASVIYGSRATRAHSAAESAIESTRIEPPAGTGARYEPIVVARKPLDGTVAANVLAHGTGALNIDACRIETTDSLSGGRVSSKNDGWDRPWKHDADAVAAAHVRGAAAVAKAETLGRWPANVILDDDQAAALDQQSGTLKSGNRKAGKYAGLGYNGSESAEFPAVKGDQGGASRFFYVAKAPKSERPVVDGVAHPTVKPLTLMRYLVRLVTPPGGTVLDMFAGSGTTIEACMLEGFDVIGIERDENYLPLILERIRRSQERPDDPGEPTLFEEPA